MDPPELNQMSTAFQDSPAPKSALNWPQQFCPPGEEQMYAHQPGDWLFKYVLGPVTDVFSHPNAMAWMIGPANPVPL